VVRDGCERGKYIFIFKNKKRFLAVEAINEEKIKPIPAPAPIKPE
jgi:hypothetical protein